MTQSDMPPTSSADSRTPSRFKLWMLIPVLVLMIFGVLALVGAGGFLWINSSTERVTVEVKDVRVALEDQDGKALGSGGGLLDPAGTLRAMRKGSARVTFRVYAKNTNRFDIAIENVAYTVRVNGVKAKPGRLPAKGKGPITLRAHKTHREPVTVKIPLEKIMRKGAMNPASLHTLEILVKGRADLVALHVPFTHTFEEAHTHQRSGSSLPLPIPFP